MGFLNSLSLPPLSSFGQAARDKPVVRQSESERRRSLVHTALAGAMRRHGIPHDWIVCHTLHVPRRRGGKPRMLVQFVVHQGDEQLLPMVHTIQDAFRREITRYDVSAPDWIAGISWEFLGDGDPRYAQMPPPQTWAGGAGASA